MENIVFNEIWGFEIALEMTLLAIASFAVVLAYLSYLEGRTRDALMGGLLGALLPTLSLIILNLHLLKPEASYLVFASFQPRSWMPWGATGIVLLLLFSAIFTLLVKFGKSSAITNVVGLVASITGIFVAVYTGLVLAYERGIPFWHSSVVPLIALTMGVVGGLSAYAVIRPLDARITVSLGITLLILVLAYVIHIHLSLIGPIASKYSAQIALGNPAFIAGVIIALIGGVLGLLTVKFKKPQVSYIMAVMGITSILLLRYILLSSGAWELPIL